MNYVLDTNILLVYLREAKTKAFIEDKYNPLGSGNNPIISVVTIGEIRSIAKMNYWGSRRLEVVEKMMKKLIITDINYEDLIEKYAEIDAFSQGRIKEKPLGLSARNMGKNDLWIAATAAITGSVLLTTDADFDHLQGTYLDLIKIEIKKN
jgi:tRNA(fMet)-specific endonuclease VapC